MKQVALQLEDHLEEMKGSLNQKKNQSKVKGVWKNRKEVVTHVRNELFKHKLALITSCEGREEWIKPKVAYFIDQRAKEFMKNKGIKILQSAFFSLQDELVKYMTDEFNSYHVT